VRSPLNKQYRPIMDAAYSVTDVHHNLSLCGICDLRVICESCYYVFEYEQNLLEICSKAHESALNSPKCVCSWGSALEPTGSSRRSPERLIG
jgi:hypothetical protein